MQVRFKKNSCRKNVLRCTSLASFAISRTGLRATNVIIAGDLVPTGTVLGTTGLRYGNAHISTITVFQRLDYYQTDNFYGLSKLLKIVVLEYIQFKILLLCEAEINK